MKSIFNASWSLVTMGYVSDHYIKIVVSFDCKLARIIDYYCILLPLQAYWVLQKPFPSGQGRFPPSPRMPEKVMCYFFM